MEQTPTLGKLLQHHSIAGALTIDTNAKQANLSLLFPQVKKTKKHFYSSLLQTLRICGPFSVTAYIISKTQVHQAQGDESKIQELLKHLHSHTVNFWKDCLQSKYSKYVTLDCKSVRTEGLVNVLE